MEAVIVGAHGGGGRRDAPGRSSRVTIFIGNYIPYIGGLVAGVFAVLLTLGDLGVGPAIAVLIAIVIGFFAGSHIGAFFIGGALRLPVTAVFVLTMAGATLAGLFGAAAAAPLARLVIDARDIIREHRAEEAAGRRSRRSGGPPRMPAEQRPPGPARAYLRYSPALALAATITRFALRRVMCTPS